MMGNKGSGRRRFLAGLTLLLALFLGIDAAADARPPRVKRELSSFLKRHGLEAGQKGRFRHGRFGRRQCRDGVDNDGDGWTDYPDDPGCRTRRGRDESRDQPPQEISPQPTPEEPVPQPTAETPAPTPVPEPAPDLSGCRHSAIPLGAGAPLGRCRPFPDDNPWNQDISGLPVDPLSDAYIAAIGAETGLHPDFGTVWDGKPIGIPYVVVDGAQAGAQITFDYAEESDGGAYPVPDEAPIEGGPSSDGDRHILVLDRDRWMLYELFYAWKTDYGWHAGSGAIFDLATNDLRPAGWTSADAAGLPIFPALVRYEEVYDQGEIRHALRFTVPVSRRAYVPPARHWASWFDDENLPPMGMRVRLKASFDLSPFPYPVQVVLTALKKYGMILADNGGPWFVTGVPDSRWNDGELHWLGEVKGRDLEVVRMDQIVEP